MPPPRPEDRFDELLRQVCLVACGSYAAGTAREVISRDFPEMLENSSPLSLATVRRRCIFGDVPAFPDTAGQFVTIPTLPIHPSNLVGMAHGEWFVSMGGTGAMSLRTPTVMNG